MSIKFTLKRKEETVEIEEANGTERVYTIRELTGKDRDTYTSLLAGKMRYDDKGKPLGMRDFSGLQITLLELSTFDPDGKSIKKAVIEAWPASTIDGLFKKAQELSGMGGDGKIEELGNG